MDTIEKHIAAGVIITLPAAVIIDETVTIGAGTVLDGAVILRGATTIGENCRVNSSQIYDSTLEDGVTVGPYAYIRPGCVLARGAHAGSFVELKNARIGENSKVPHLSYVGDADLGRHVNFGCGAITANFDGGVKSRTVVGDDVFVGSNSVLVAPVTVGDGAFIAAGSTVSGEIPADALAIARVKDTTIKENWAKNRAKNW
jgi:bifunctional UDP-N-acetylglucosamine pyrophosphorylase/glucosamine-1-phosphate N-acetyltransferase